MNTDSGKLVKSVHAKTGIGVHGKTSMGVHGKTSMGVHGRPESVFTLGRNMHTAYTTGYCVVIRGFLKTNLLVSWFWHVYPHP